MTLSREQWLEERKKGIGGSDSAAVLGLSKWKSPYQVWCDKKGYNFLESSDNASLFWGRTLEPVIRQHYSDITGYSVAETEIYFMPDHDYIFATVDGLVIEDPDRILEIKTARTAEGWGEPETDQIPVEYLCQCQHYMMVYNRHITDVAVLIGGSDFRIYHVEASTEVQNHLLREYANFWKLVETDTPPEPRSFDDVMRRFKESTDNSIEATPYIQILAQQMKAAKEQSTSLENLCEELKTKIAAFMGENEVLTSAEQILATWKYGKPRQFFDKPRFQADHPKLFKKYNKETAPKRTFLIK
nr:MAG TPA: Exonuclease [Caudoviricetes sp.]